MVHMWVYVYLGLVPGGSLVSGHPRQLGWKKMHSCLIWGPGRPQPSSMAPAPRQLVSQLEQAKVPEQ